ncbi:CaiB/BaiF CoA transferase family protein [Nocardia goodfellowii]
MTAQSALPLQGITVISLEQAVAAPFATRQLADLGARVIKIERPGGGDFARRYDETVLGQSSYFVWLNRSKESLTLDVKSEAGQRVLERLLARADVVVQNLAPGAARRLGLDAGSVMARHPRMIVCDISGFGADGPTAGRKAYDLLVQAEAGLVSLTGIPEHPAKVGISIADIAAGMYAYSGILTALLQRTGTGRGTAVQVSLFDALAEWMGSPLYYTRYGGAEPKRVGAEHATIAPYGPFQTADGMVLLAVQNEREWSRFCAGVLETPELTDDSRFATNSARVANRVACNALIAARFADISTADAITFLDKAGIANARMSSVTQFLEHPALGERDRWREVQTPSGPIQALLPPAILGGVSPVMGPIPDLGEHTGQILSELGYRTGDIEGLRAEHVI